MTSTKRPIIILDANAFISCAKITHLGKNYRLVTTSDVIAELKDEKTKTYLQTIPFQIEQLDYDDKSLQIVKEFAKKTGDIGSLSDIDMQLIALAHTLYIKESLTEKLRKQPLPLVEKIVQDEEDETVPEEGSEYSDSGSEESQGEEALGDEDGWITVPSNKKKQEQEEDSDMDDEEGWVTPANYAQKMSEINTAYLETKKQQSVLGNLPKDVMEEKQNEVEFSISLISADFAIQNVATHMGIKLIALDGRVISSIRRFIWECYLCFKQINVTENRIKLCPGCGYNSLSKISYNMDTKGNVILHRKRGWKPNQKVQEWKDKKYEEQQKRKKHQHERRTKKTSIFQTM